MGGRCFKPGGSDTRFHKHHRFCRSCCFGRFNKPFTGADILKVTDDDFSLFIFGQPGEQIDLVNIGLVADGNHFGNSKVSGAAQVEHGCTHRPGLRKN